MSTIVIRKRLNSNMVNLGKRVHAMLGKKVEITIREVSDPKPKERKWTTLGSVNLGGELDPVNIRDFAHDD